MQLEKHTVILNWHEHAEKVIRQLCVQAELAGRGDRETTVVTIDDGNISLPRMMKVEEDEHVGEHFVHGIALNNGEGRGSYAGLKPVYVFAADPAKPATLSRVQIEKAHTVIVFPNMALDDPDGPTAITVLNIQRRINRTLAETDADSCLHRPRVIVWCANPDNVEVFRDESFGLDDVCSTEWAWRVICQAASVPHVSNVYRRLMTASENTNEFYDFTLPDDWQRCRFHEIQDFLQDYNLKNAETLRGREKQKNTVMVIGYCKREDNRREHLRLNPNPGMWVEAGDTLLALTYICDRKTRESILAHLVTKNRERELEVGKGAGVP